MNERGRQRPTESRSTTRKETTRKDGSRKTTSRRDAPRKDTSRGEATRRGTTRRDPIRDDTRSNSRKPPAARRGFVKGEPEKNNKKRTSKNTDDRNPTRSGIEYPTKKYRNRDETPVEEPRPRASLRKVERSRAPEPGRKSSKKRPPAKRAPARGSARRRNVKTTEATDELARLARRDARSALEQLSRAADAYQAGRERDAMRMLRPLRDAYPDASAVRELMGLCQYRVGNYAAAAKELEAFVVLTDSVEQHPVLMDCMRAMGKYKRVDELWDELATASPSSALVTEGRIVYAGSKADRGRVRDAIGILDRRSGDVKRVQEHHLRLWYALADLYERAGDNPHARDLFIRIRRHNASFADVAERLSVLG